MRMATTMATQRSYVRTGTAISCSISLLLSIITMTTVNGPAALVMADHPNPLKLYITLELATVVTVTAPEFTGTEYGTITLSDSVVRAGKSENSTVIGDASGHTTYLKGGYLLVDFVYRVDMPSYAGTITGQGETNSTGDGELAVTGGTGEFRGANGYVELKSIATFDDTVLFEAFVYFI